MPYTIDFNPDLQIIEIKFQGNIVLEEVEKIFSASMQMAKERNCFLFLSDYRNATMKLSTLELYELPDLLTSIFSPAGIPAYKLKRALVVAKDLEDYHFFEVVTANRGQHTQIFQDMDKAREWLLNK